ncbi:MAG: hypothetical protein ABW208_07280 [Pyrinomonadaceae bacterium]
MSVEPTELPLLGNSDLHLRPFAQRTAKQFPELWARFIHACERERVTEVGLSPEEFLDRCTTAVRTLNNELENELTAERSN